MQFVLPDGEIRKPLLSKGGAENPRVSKYPDRILTEDTKK
jgi:hypothetical protein